MIILAKFGIFLYRVRYQLIGYLQLYIPLLNPLKVFFSQNSVFSEDVE